MARLTETAVVETPIDEVFAYLADFSSAEQWDPGVSSAERLDDGALGVGSRFLLRFGVGPVTWPLTYATVTSQPTGHLVHRTWGSVHRGRDDIRLHAVDETTTRIVWDAEFALRGPGVFVDPFLKVAFRRAAAGAMEGLARELGGRRTTEDV